MGAMRSVVIILCLGSVLFAVASLYVLSEDVSVAGPVPPLQPPRPADMRVAPKGQVIFMAPAAVPSPMPSKAAQIDRLTATGNPQDAFDAFELAGMCKITLYRRRFGPNYASAEDVTSACGDITELQMRELDKNINKAIAADVPRALLVKFLFGPRGVGPDLDIGKSTDPAVVDWRDNMLRELSAYAKRTGDTDTMFELAQAYYFGTLRVLSRELAIGYLIAIERLNAQSTDPKRQRLAKIAPASAYYMADGLTAEQTAAGHVFANNFLADCCRNR